MTSAGVESASFQPFSMADDSMEISSELGGHNANDDIDIDIDFTAGPTDEDYMLEDAESDVEFRESFENVPQNTNDDVMVDDYNSSFPIEEQHYTDNDEQLQDVPDEILDEPEMDISNNELPASDHADSTGSDHGTQGPISDVQLADSALETTSIDVNQGTSQVRSPQHGETLLPAESPSPSFPPGLPNDTNTIHESHANMVNDDESKSSSEKNTSVDDGKHLHDSGDYAEHQAEPVSAHDDATVIETEATEEIPNEEQAHTVDMDEAYSRIMVSYQDTQYALFSSSENDDSDSFFLKDRSIIQEPISSFLNALRDILQEELADDDELCIGIDVLRLEFGERSAEIDKVTFEELIYLHQQLLRNDGVDSPEPLHFTLGTRPEFAKRYVGLLAGASEGKGLSELIPRDEESESFDDVETSTHLEDDYGQDHDYIQADDADDQGHHTPHDDENAIPVLLDRSEEDVEGESVPAIPSTPEELDQIVNGHSIGAADEEDKEDGAHNSENSTNYASPAPAGDVVSDSHEAQAEQNTTTGSTSVAEQQDEDDGDLIDYGDEEVDNTKPIAPPPDSRDGNYPDFFTPCLKPGVCFCSACNEVLIANYEALNEELRRRSLSRAAANEPPTHGVDEAPNDGSGVAEAQEPANDQNDADEIDFDIDGEVNQVDGASLESHNNEANGAEAQEVQDDQGKVDDYYTGFDDDQEREGETYGFEEEFNDGQNFEGEDQNLEDKPEGLKVVTSTVTEVASLESNETSPHEEISAESVTVSADTVDIDEIDYDDDLPTTTVEASNPQQAHNSGTVEDIDEIDYDDDDDVEGVVTPESTKPESVQYASSGTPGKRQRSDSMSEAALGEGNQEAKRVRS